MGKTDGKLGGFHSHHRSLTNSKKNRKNANFTRKAKALNKQAAEALGAAPTRGAALEVKVPGTYQRASNAAIVAVGLLFESGALTTRKMWENA
jgi:hypothetical protein